MMGLGEEEAQEKFGFLLDAFAFGAAAARRHRLRLGPHRAPCSSGSDSIRDVIAFPKSGGGFDPLTAAPAPITARAAQGGRRRRRPRGARGRAGLSTDGAADGSRNGAKPACRGRRGVDRASYWPAWRATARRHRDRSGEVGPCRGDASARSPSLSWRGRPRSRRAPGRTTSTPRRSPATCRPAASSSRCRRAGTSSLPRRSRRRSPTGRPTPRPSRCSTSPPGSRRTTPRSSPRWATCSAPVPPTSPRSTPACAASTRPSRPTPASSRCATWWFRCRPSGRTCGSCATRR